MWPVELLLDAVGGVLFFTPWARRRKHTKQVITAAKTFVWSYEDLPEWNAKTGMGMLRKAAWTGEVEKCEKILSALQPKLPCQTAREWLDILVVAVSVAMAFRAYFYEPFNIPTGSMQPTLYGNHSETCAVNEATFWDKGPQKWLKWAWTGSMYYHYTAPVNGNVAFRDRRDGYLDMAIVSAGYVTEVGKIPADVVQVRDNFGQPVAALPTLPNGIKHGDYVRTGQELWSGRIVTGDFLFVNRWIWNFRKPRRGEVMIFATTGIPGLQQGTHYIKRMVGVPNEELTIRDGKLWSNGVAQTAPERIAQITARQKFAPWAYPYAGFRASGDARFAVAGRTIAAEGDIVKLGADEFFACGDNSPNSFDSRYWGPVPGKNLVGLAGGVFWPFGSPRWGNIK